MGQRDEQKFRPSGLAASGAEVERAFREMVKSLACPGCGVEFTDHAVEWGDAWLEGRIDLLREEGWQERDGPYKLKCELCGHRSWLDYFERSVRSSDGQADLGPDPGDDSASA